MIGNTLSSSIFFFFSVPFCQQRLLIRNKSLSYLSSQSFLETFHPPLTFLTQGQDDELWEVACDGCLESCKNCDFGGTVLVPECISLSEVGLEHASSDGGVATLKELVIDEGYWRATNTSMDILECYNNDACNGGVTGTAGFCRKGYHGACE